MSYPLSLSMSLSPSIPSMNYQQTLSFSHSFPEMVVVWMQQHDKNPDSVPYSVAASSIVNMIRYSLWPVRHSCCHDVKRGTQSILGANLYHDTACSVPEHTAQTRLFLFLLYHHKSEILAYANVEQYTSYTQLDLISQPRCELHQALLKLLQVLIGVEATGGDPMWACRRDDGKVVVVSPEEQKELDTQDEERGLCIDEEEEPEEEEEEKPDTVASSYRCVIS
jgi:hypothetical protein